MVPAPNTIAFSPCFGIARRAARQPTVNGSIRLASLEDILPLTAYTCLLSLAFGISTYSEKPPVVPARFGSPLARRGYGYTLSPTLISFTFLPI